MTSLIMALMLSWLSACGAKAPNKKNSKDLYEKESQLLFIEKECAQAMAPLSPLTDEINALYGRYFKENPWGFMNVPVVLYDYKDPLRLSPWKLKKSLNELKEKLNSNGGLLGKNAAHLFHLHQNANRFESMKCSFNSLAQKQAYDIRPYMELNNFCQQKEGTTLCGDQSFLGLTEVESKFVEEKALHLCRSFFRPTNCMAQLGQQKRQYRFADMVKHYQKRFQQERVESLFKLRPNHLRYNCTEQRSDEAGKHKLVTTMTIKVYEGQWNKEELAELLGFVSLQWSRPGFTLNFEQVSEKPVANENVIEILPSQGFISYVPDNNNRVVHLSNKLDFNTKKKILAHEFGHVLGFPDCYVEFFDEEEKELVYYEHSATEPNIMCSLKSGVRVPDDYLLQLREKSCLFH